MYEEYEKYDDHMMHDFDGQPGVWMESGKMLTCQTAVNTKKGTMDDIEVCSQTHLTVISTSKAAMEGYYHRLSTDEAQCFYEHLVRKSNVATKYERVDWKGQLEL